MNNKNDNIAKKGKQAGVKEKADDPRVKTVTQDNENGDPGPPAEEEHAENGNESKTKTHMLAENKLHRLISAQDKITRSH